MAGSAKRSPARGRSGRSRDRWSDVRWGLRWGLYYGSFYAALLIAATVLGRRDVFRNAVFSNTAVIVVYGLVGPAIGALVGLARPATRTIPGPIAVGAVVGFAVGSGLSLVVMGTSALNPGHAFMTAAFTLAGPVAALSIRLPHRTGGGE